MPLGGGPLSVAAEAEAAAWRTFVSFGSALAYLSVPAPPSPCTSEAVFFSSHPTPRSAPATASKSIGRFMAAVLITGLAGRRHRADRFRCPLGSRLKGRGG